MNVLVTFAVDAEFAPWRKLRSFQKQRGTKNNSALRRAPSFMATIGDNRVGVLLTGIGKVACQAALAQYAFPQDANPHMVISSGLAGALSGRLKAGDLVAPRKVRTLNNDANADADPALWNRLIQMGASPVDDLITVDRVVQTASEKTRLAFFGEVVDMESAIIMSSFASASVPVVTVRAISDAADEDLPIDFDRCLTPQGAVRPMSLVNAIVRRPGNLPNLVRFGRQSNMAAQKLAAFLDNFVASVPFSAGAERIAVA
jgi:adenosylhomocysteine nucleosidase